jgi:hypothetical protein
MKFIKTITIIFFIIQSTYLFAQDVAYYIQIEDPDIVPEITKDKDSDILKVKAKDNDLNLLYSKYSIKKFKKAFPKAVTPSLENVYFIKWICFGECSCGISYNLFTKLDSNW